MTPLVTIEAFRERCTSGAAAAAAANFRVQLKPLLDHQRRRHVLSGHRLTDGWANIVIEENR